MYCENCGQVSDTVGEDTDWAVRGASTGGRQRYTCQGCGHTQWVR